jgi:preprotein translocase subunit SecF
MNFFRETNIDFLGKKWHFLTLTMTLFIIGMIALAVHHGPLLGIDFTGGTVVDVKFQKAPPTDTIRGALGSNAIIQPKGGAGANELYISLPLSALNASQLDIGRERVVQTLYKIIGSEPGKLDINAIGRSRIADWLFNADPDHMGSAGADQARAHYEALATAMLKYRDNVEKGLLPSIDALRNVPGVSAADVAAMKSAFYPGGFAVREASTIGPEVGAQLRGQALRATLFALAGMLVYVAFRFETIYGVAAVVAVFHDVLITLGMFSVFGLPISLTVIAAFLTLVGYSMNDTIVVFDRVRENLKILRRDRLATVVNRSINQTLSRTILSSGLTFLSVLSLLLLGGDALRGFSFAMTFGILVGTYSSIAVAAPMMVAYIEWRNRRLRPSAAVESRRPERAEKLARSRG